MEFLLNHRSVSAKNTGSSAVVEIVVQKMLLINSPERAFEFSSHVPRERLSVSVSQTKIRVTPSRTRK